MVDYKEFFLFKNLNYEQQKRAVALFDEVKIFEKGEIIYSEKNFNKAFGFIVSGSARAQTNNNKGVVMQKFSAGDSFGVAALFGGEESYVSTIVAESRSEIQFLNEETLLRLFEEFPVTAVNYIGFLSDKVRFLNRKLSIISCSNAQDTVLRYLSGIADENGEVRLPDNMSLLARSLGLGRTSLYRSLEALESGGVIVRKNNIIRMKEL